KLRTLEPLSFVFGDSEIWAVWMSAGAIPADFRAAMRRFMRVALPASAAFAVGAGVGTPEENCASAGTGATMRGPCRVDVREGALVAGAANAAAAAAGASTVMVNHVLIALSRSLRRRGQLCHTFPTAVSTCPEREARAGVPLNMSLTPPGYLGGVCPVPAPR